MANYLEYGLRRDDPDFEPVVEEGSWEAAKAFLDRALSMRGSLAPEEADALDRLAANLDRLKAYDPAFAPDIDEDAPPSPYADDEEVDPEILAEEDSALADELFAAENAASEDSEEDELDDMDEDLNLLWDSDDFDESGDDWDKGDDVPDEDEDDWDDDEDVPDEDNEDE